MHKKLVLSISLVGFLSSGCVATAPKSPEERRSTLNLYENNKIAFRVQQSSGTQSWHWSKNDLVTVAVIDGFYYNLKDISRIDAISDGRQQGIGKLTVHFKEGESQVVAVNKNAKQGSYLTWCNAEEKCYWKIPFLGPTPASMSRFNALYRIDDDALENYLYLISYPLKDFEGFLTPPGRVTPDVANFVSLDVLNDGQADYLHENVEKRREDWGEFLTRHKAILEKESLSYVGSEDEIKRSGGIIGAVMKSTRELEIARKGQQGLNEVALCRYYGECRTVLGEQ